jgi:hypothetical protein
VLEDAESPENEGLYGDPGHNEGSHLRSSRPSCGLKRKEEPGDAHNKQEDIPEELRDLLLAVEKERCYHESAIMTRRRTLTISCRPANPLD